MSPLHPLGPRTPPSPDALVALRAQVDALGAELDALSSTVERSRVLARAQVVSTVTIPAGTSGSGLAGSTPITGLSATVTCDGGPIRMEFTAPTVAHFGTGQVYVFLLLDGATIAGSGSIFMSLAGANGSQSLTFSVEATPTAGVHTISTVVVNTPVSGTPNVSLNASEASPITLRIDRVT